MEPEHHPIAAEMNEKAATSPSADLALCGSRRPAATPSDDVWLAYRYLAGELSDADWREAEARLADDVQLQSALADMVPIVAAMQTEGGAQNAAAARAGSLPGILPRDAVVGRNTADRSQRGRLWPVAMLCVASMALLACGLLLRMPLADPHPLATAPGPTMPAVTDGTASTEDALEVAALDVPVVIALWSALCTDDSRHEDHFNSGSQETRVSSGNGSFPESDDAPVVEEIEVPRWLLVAVLADDVEDSVLDPSGTDRL